MVEKIIKVISNLKVLSKINEIIDGLNTHTTNTNNPHNVTAEQLGLATAYVYKGSVTNFSDLPTNAQNGWVYSVENAHTDSSGVVHPSGANFAWDGSKWDDLGGSLSGYATLDFVENRVIPIEKGGTGATSVAGARKNLGIEDVTTYDILPIEKGGTGANNASDARKNLGVNDFVTSLSVSGKTITYNKKDGTSGTITTQDTVYTHPNSGVSAGTYRSVTVNAQGHVTGGSNPAKLDSAGLLNLIYPVGSLYWSKKNTSPATLFGGKWVQIKDKFILACGDSYAVGKTGGSATVTLTTAQLPAHNHSASTNTTGGHTHTTKIGYNVASGTGYGKYMPPDNGVQRNDNLTSSSAGNHGHTVTVNNTGGGQAHENMPPYVTYYCWERTA